MHSITLELHCHNNPNQRSFLGFRWTIVTYFCRNFYWELFFMLDMNMSGEFKSLEDINYLSELKSPI